jgi:hypothetical protein
VGSRCEGAEAFLGRIYVHRSDLEEGGLAQAYPGSRLQFNLVPGRDTATLRAVKVGPCHRKQCCGSGMLIPDPNFFHRESRVKKTPGSASALKNLSNGTGILNQKNVS